MNMSTLSTTQVILIIAAVVVAVGVIAAMLLTRKRRTARWRGKFGGPEYDRTVLEGGNQRRARGTCGEFPYPGA